MIVISIISLDTDIFDIQTSWKHIVSSKYYFMTLVMLQVVLMKVKDIGDVRRPILTYLCSNYNHNSLENCIICYITSEYTSIYYENTIV